MGEHSIEAKPDWLDNSFLSVALRSYKHDPTIEVSNFTINTGFSEHFASTMFQSTIDYSSLKYPKSAPETLGVVIKAKPVSEGYKMQVVEGGPLFETEIKMYNEVIPIMNQLFERSGMKVELGPEVIYATDKPFEIIILKDLSSAGYLSPRTAPDELEDSKMIIQRLAQFHAASYYLAENNEFDFSSFNHSIYQQPDILKGFFEDTFNAFREALGTWDDSQQHIPKLDYFMEHLAEIGQKAYKANIPGDGFNILNHGDFHSRNFLVKINESKRWESFYFIDYQLSVYCSPAVDLRYALGLVKRDSNGEVPTEELIMFYHEEFVKTLKTFGFMKSPPTLLDLNIELLKHGSVNVLHMICFIPYSFVDWNTMKVEDFMTEGDGRNFKKKLYENPLCKQLLQKEMKSWVQKGWF